MPLNKTISSDEQVVSEAAAWIAQIESGPMSQQDRAALGEWISRSPSHRIALRQCARAWADSDRLAGLALYFDKARRDHRNFVRPWRRGVGLRVTAACLAMAAVFALLLFSDRVNRPFGENASVLIATGRGETDSAKLPDGSLVSVNSFSRVEVSIREHAREVLLEEGEAMFQVAADAERPFTVYAGDRAVQAIGTVFSVRYDGKSTVVAVLEGSVRLLPKSGVANWPGGRKATGEVKAIKPEAVIVAGQESITTPNAGTKIEPIPVAKLEQRATWRYEKLDFSGERLGFVLSEISRYTGTNFQLADNDLADMKVGGVFQLSDADQAVDVIVDGLGLEIESLPNGEVLIKRRVDGE